MIYCNQIAFHFSNITSSSLAMAIVGYLVVFSALVTMVLALKQVTRIQQFVIKQRVRRKEGHKKEENQEKPSLTGDENAAICTALYLYFTELHDEEKYVMTVKKVSKTYSPWSSKIYGIMNNIRK